MSPRKNQMNKQSQKRKLRRNNRSGARVDPSTQELGDSNRLPKSTSAVDRRPGYNPTWNPQYLKVARTFQLTAPPADIALGFGKYFDPAFTPSATLLAYNSAAFVFSISDIPSVTEFGVLFDQYRIAAVTLRFDFITSSESVGNPANGLAQQMTLMVFEDNDDGTAPTATNVGWQAVYETGRAVQRVFPNRTNTFSYTVKPKYLTADVDSSATTTGRSLAAGWCDGATGLDIVWRGIKWIGQTNPTTATASAYNFRVTATYYTEWRARQ